MVLLENMMARNLQDEAKRLVDAFASSLGALLEIHEMVIEHGDEEDRETYLNMLELAEQAIAELTLVAMLNDLDRQIAGLYDFHLAQVDLSIKQNQRMQLVLMSMKSPVG